MSKWVKAMNVSDVPQGTGSIVAIGDKQIAVFCVEGQYYAIDNTCPHRGGPLGEGELDGPVVTCPWHGWEFDVTTGVSPINPAACVKCFDCKVEGDGVLIRADG